jgi:hypothetical protein
MFVSGPAARCNRLRHLSCLVFFGVISMLVVGGCSSSSCALKRPEHIVIVDPNGRLLDGNFKPTSDTWLTNIFDNLPSRSPATNILIFFQGGLNHYSDGVQRANTLSDRILNDPISCYYPIFFTWDSDLTDCWGDHLSRVLPTGEDRTNHNWGLLIFNGPADLGRLVGRIPLTFALTSRNLFESVFLNEKAALGFTNTITQNQQYHIPPDQMDKAFSALTNGAMRILLETNDTTFGRQYFRSMKISLLGYPNMVGSLVIDTGGKEGWDQMRNNVCRAKYIR